MPRSTVPPSQPGHAGLATVEQTLVLAFLDDPMAAYLFGGPSRRARGLRWIFGVELRHAARRGLVETLESCKAVAIWIRPDRSSRVIPDLVRSGALSAPFALGPWAALRLLLLMREMHGLHATALTGPHWYLLGLAVHPARQGGGLGSKLLRNGMARAQAAKLPCYLETTNEANVAFYARYGFQAAGRRTLGGSGLSLWAMSAG